MLKSGEFLAHFSKPTSVQVTPLPSRLVLLDINQIKTKDLDIKSRSLLKEFIFFLDIPEHWTWVTLKSAEPMCLLDLQDKEGALRFGFNLKFEGGFVERPTYNSKQKFREYLGESIKISDNHKRIGEGVV